MKKTAVKILTSALLVTSALGVLTGCGSKSGKVDDAKGTTGESKVLAGEIKVDGSSTVAPITEAVAEEFNKEYKDVKIPIGVSGTGGGFKRFVVGETDIQDASRPIKDSEKEIANANGVTYTDFTVAYDGITLVVSKDNDFVDSLTKEELKKLWEPDSKIKTWKDLRPEWPAENIKFYSPGPDSGTFEFFTEAIVEKAKAMRSDVNPSEDDNVLVQGVAGDKNAIGFFGYSYYESNKDKLKAIKIDAGKGAVEPTFETIKDGTYVPLARPVFIYANNKSLEKTEVKEFVKFYLENAETLVKEIGEIPLTADKYKEELAKIK
ncbi:phosphate ABC transporter substrate-binding protein PstS family protein [Clostridium sp.]|uniref:PstS family phosphate ABC transporter substrate-binding protein n=1 Tax=Clostridium sp. TaxID=1506 RepID=UPI00399464FF